MKIMEALLTGPQTIELHDKELVPLGGNDVLVEVVACGVCTSEIPAYLGEAEGVRGVSFRYDRYPCYLGHEVAGLVTDVGPGVKNLKPGDRVTGVAYRGSGFASHVVDSEVFFVKIPNSIPLEHALGEPLMAVTNIIRMSQPDFGDFVFIAGDGFMSLLTIAALGRYPLKALVISGHHDNRLKLAREFGGTYVFNAKKVDAYWEVRKLLDGSDHDPAITRWENGVDIAFDFAGRMSALQLCASLCKPKQRGKLMMPSYYGPESYSLGHYVMNRAPSLIACHPAHSQNVMEDLKRAIWALKMHFFPISRLITHAFTLDQVDLAMDTAILRRDGYIKGIIVPNFAKLESKTTYKNV
jgi:threonine dehydrogenase-like Zn-dependent dehydrogenase